MRIRVPSSAKAGPILAGVAIVVAACASSGSSSAPSGSGGAQVVQTAAAGEACTNDKYNGGVPKLDLKAATVGFAQSEKEANPFRIAETQSIKDEAAKRGIKLLTTNAESDLNKEISDIKGMIDQGAQVLIISPLNSEGLDPALDYAKSKKVPIMTIDRFLTTKTACTDYIGWVGSDFVVQGQRAFDALSAATGDNCNLAVLLGAAGVNVTNDREKGFEDQMAAKSSKMKVIAKQAADYERAKGQTVTAQLIQANPEINCIYAHNDEMALGAVAALKDAGKKPGDVKILTIDGTKGAVQGIIDGWISGVIESNPRFGPLAFKALDDFYGGAGVPIKTIISDKEYTKDNAASELANAY
ncbi:MAG: ABC transporter substrate-binding protein [Chloroflexota bacterium]|jgi:ABC-type sugar transport system substrate-binding protein